MKVWARAGGSRSLSAILQYRPSRTKSIEHWCSPFPAPSPEAAIIAKGGAVDCKCWIAGADGKDCKKVSTS